MTVAVQSAAAQSPAARGARTDAKLLAVDTENTSGADGAIRSFPRDDLPELLRPGDLLIANDAATIPASLTGTHEPTGRPIEIRLAGRPSLRADDLRRFVALAFGAGDWHTPTEDRPPPPSLRAGDRLLFGRLRATVTGLLGHPRLVGLAFEGDVGEVWSGIAAHGRPIQYAHVPEPLALWDVWTPVAAHPVAFEPPSAGFTLRWETLARLGPRHVSFATLTHAAGLSSTGDPALDARLPFDEPYHIPIETVRRVRRTRRDGGRVIAIGTTVVRALEHAALATGGVRPGLGTATQRIGAATRLRVVDGILTGVHEPSTSHYQLLRAFADDRTLAAAGQVLDEERYRTHEFGDSMLLLRGLSDGRATSSSAPPGP
jgi:S-adenosylmethionine:tRNA ribosyltransferase-isomerase